MDNMEHIMEVLGQQNLLCPFIQLQLMVHIELEQVRHRSIELLYGGELQRFALALVCVQKADVYVWAYFILQ